MSLQNTWKAQGIPCNAEVSREVSFESKLPSGNRLTVARAFKEVNDFKLKLNGL